VHLAQHPATLLPIPGVVWGQYPQRPDAMAAASWGGFGAASLFAAVHDAVAQGLAPVRSRATQRREQAQLQLVRDHQRVWHSLNEPAHEARLQRLRARLARDGWIGALRAEALGCVASAGERALGRSPFDTQLQAASVLLEDRLAEMATGEGKTYAAALAAAVAGLAGVPVHVMTANDYLVERDAQQLRLFYASLGLRVGAVLATSSPEARRAAYACDVTYCTAREVAFDYLRDSVAAASCGSELMQRSLRLAGERGPALLLRGLCMAVLDEADSILIDEATMPLVLSEATDDAQLRAACFQALALARQLQVGADVHLDRVAGRIEWTDAGSHRLEQLSSGLDKAWCNRRHRHDLVGAALEALHLLERDRHYLVRDGAVQLLDGVTGRAAPGRVWSRGLQTLVELKEGCAVTPSTTTRAQISFQRFFARYVRLCGMSGTLAECRREIAALYQREVVAIATRRPSQRRLLPDRLFVDSAWRRQAVVQRVTALYGQGRPVLIGTDSVGESQTLAGLLGAAGVPHRVLNARHDQEEAQIVAMAGQLGAVTVATQMAGRGTDIVLGPAVPALGGLHVLNCQDNPSARLDRQLIGRSARQGDPGSAETWRVLDAAQWRRNAFSSVLRAIRKHDESGAMALPQWLMRSWAARLQDKHERGLSRQRFRLLEQDREWERQLNFSK
jgi:preprotein translocase subunit SecA